eukprot:Pgem_evm1s17670
MKYKKVWKRCMKNKIISDPIVRQAQREETLEVFKITPVWELRTEPPPVFAQLQKEEDERVENLKRQIENEDKDMDELRDSSPAPIYARDIKNYLRQLWPERPQLTHRVLKNYLSSLIPQRAVNEEEEDTEEIDMILKMFKNNNDKAEEEVSYS